MTGLMHVMDLPLIKPAFIGENRILWVLLLIFPTLFYSFLWETFNSGRSPGKMLFGMRVVMHDGSTPTIGASIMRWIILLFDMWMSIGVVAIIIDASNRRIGDLAAGTVIIKERDYHRIQVSLDEFQYLSREYKPVFPHAGNLSLEQVNAINEVLARCDAERQARIAALAVRVREFLKISPDISDEEFLATLERDYQYYAIEEV